MSPRPDTWMPLYWGDYLRDTGHLSTAEHGAYLLLIAHYWITGRPLADDDTRLARLVRMALKEWRDIRDTIAAFFQVGDGLWRHKRVDNELAKAHANVKAKAEAGAKGAAKRWRTDSGGIAGASQKEWQTASQKEWQTDAPLPSPSPSPPPSEDSPSLRSGVSAASADLPDPPPFLDKAKAFNEAVEGWNALAKEHGLPVVREKTDARRRAFNARFGNGSAGKFGEALAAIRASKFCQGDNPRGWRAGFDFILQPSSLAKLLEGSYADRAGAAMDSTGIDWGALKAKNDAA